MKFLEALQDDTGNNFSYLVSMNIVRIYLLQRGTLYSRVKCPPPFPPPPPHLNPYVLFHFYVMIFFCAKNIFSSHLATIATGSANPGDSLPWGKMPPPPSSTLMYSFIFVMMKGIEKTLFLAHLSRRLTRRAYSIPMVRRPSVVRRPSSVVHTLKLEYL